MEQHISSQDPIPHNSSIDVKLNNLEKLTLTSSTKVMDSQFASNCLEQNIYKILLFQQAPSISEFGIIKPISRGAFGKVYLAYKLTDKNKLYAVKVKRRNCGKISKRKLFTVSAYFFHFEKTVANEKV